MGSIARDSVDRVDNFLMSNIVIYTNLFSVAQIMPVMCMLSQLIAVPLQRGLV